jgi:ATPase subunit of ABC transporter with duplicated ATPase domains
MSSIVTCRGLRKRYGPTGPWVLRDVDASVAPGGVVHLSGPNGAGKSTLLRIVAGACVPSAGTRRLASGTAVGYAPERSVPPRTFSSAQYLDHHARLRGLGAAEGRRQVEQLAARLGCEPALGQRLGDQHGRFAYEAHHLRDDRQHQLVLALEVAVHGAGAQVGLAEDVLHRRAVEAGAHETALGGVEDPGAALLYGLVRGLQAAVVDPRNGQVLVHGCI